MFKSSYFILMLLLGAFLLPMGSAFSQEVVLKGGQSITLRIAGVPAEDVSLVSGTFSISDGGTIRLPYLREGITAAGLKPSALARKIEAVYRSAEIYTAPTVQVTSTQIDIKNRIVSVLGEVRSPGSVNAVAGMTLIDTIAQTGGFTDFAKTKNIKLTRGTKVTYHDLSKGDPKENVIVQANDIITVR